MDTVECPSTSLNDFASKPASAHLEAKLCPYGIITLNPENPVKSRG
jgi:hypothetical protein